MRSVSPFLIRPVSMYIGVNLSPIARFASTAQTELSTPPESAIMVYPLASFLIRSMLLGMNFWTFTIAMNSDLFTFEFMYGSMVVCI